MDRSYRLYSICEEGSITGAMNREFADDDEALAHARRLLAKHPAVELWQTHRLVGRVETGAAGLAATLAGRVRA